MTNPRPKGMIALATQVAEEFCAEPKSDDVSARSELDLQRWLDVLPTAAYICDADGLITFFNQRAVEAWGREPKRNDPADRFCGSFKMFSTDGSPMPHDQCWTALALRKDRAFKDQEVVIERPDGSRSIVLANVSVIYDKAGQVVGAVNIVVDITRQKQMESALRQSEAQFHQLADAMPQIVWAARPDGHVDYYNERWYEYTGFSRGVFGQQSWESILHGDDLQRCVDTYFDCIKAERSYQIEYRFKDRRTNGYRWFLGRAVPVRDEQGRIVRWFGTCTDIDDTKKTEEALQKADHRKNDFLATLAHELRNPLGPIRNGLHLIRLEGGLTENIKQARIMMERQLAQLVRLVDDLMDLTRISNDKLELRKERVQLTVVVQSAVETSRPLIEEMGHLLTVTLPQHPLIVDADSTRLAQVFLNLLNNAAKYSDKGGHIQLHAERQGSDVVVSVKDTGIGLATDQLPRIFEMFSQVNRSWARAQDGLGIGLTLVKRLVEMHGGSIEVRSDGPGKGSEFSVRLPVVVEASIPRAVDERDGVLIPRSSLRIVVVDDNVDAAESLAMMLRIMGNDTRTAYDGQQGADMAEAFRPDVILLDIGLPKLNGYEACRHIREQSWGKNVVLIAVTGWCHEEDRRRSHEAGFDHHMDKPVDPQALMKMLAGLHAMKT